MKAEYARLITRRYLASSSGPSAHFATLHTVIYPAISGAMHHGMSNVIINTWISPRDITLLQNDGYRVDRSPEMTDWRVTISWSAPPPVCSAASLTKPVCTAGAANHTPVAIDLVDSASSQPHAQSCAPNTP